MSFMRLVLQIGTSFLMLVLLICLSGLKLLRSMPMLWLSTLSVFLPALRRSSAVCATPSVGDKAGDRPSTVASNQMFLFMKLSPAVGLVFFAKADGWWGNRAPSRRLRFPPWRRSYATFRQAAKARGSAACQGASAQGRKPVARWDRARSHNFATIV